MTTIGGNIFTPTTFPMHKMSNPLGQLPEPQPLVYRQDADLAFLKDVPSKDLDDLVGILTKDKDGSPRLTEELTQSDEYQLHNPDHHQYWELIAAELQCFGANTLATMVRGGEGVLYREILIDICEKQKVNYNEKSSVPHLEKCLVEKMLKDGIVEMPEGDLKAFCEKLDIKTTSYTREAVLLAVRIAFKRAGFAPYPIALKVANTVARNLLGRGLAFATNTALTRGMGYIIPGLDLVLAAWTLNDIAGPAYRVTVPATLIVSGLRSRALEAEQLGNVEKKKKKKGKKKKSTKTSKKPSNGADGLWNTVMDTPMGPQEAELLLVTDGGALSGYIMGAQGDLEIKEGTVEGNSLAWKVDITTPMAMTLEYTAAVKGDSINGTVKLGAFGDASLTGTRA